MSSFASSWAWKQHVSPAGRKFVLVALAEFADAEGVCRVSQAELAEMTGQTTRSVVTHLAELEVAGLITREPTRDEDGYRDLDVIRLMAAKVPRRKREKAVRDDVQPCLGETPAGHQLLGEKVSRGPGSLPEKVSPQETSFLPYVRKDVPNTSPACTALDSGLPEVGGGGGTSNIEHPTPNTPPDGTSPGEAGPTSLSRAVVNGAHLNCGRVQVRGAEQVPPAAVPYRAALTVIDTAGLTPTWAQWIRANALQPAAQEAQATVWQAWIDAGHTVTLKAHVLDLVQSGGSFAHPWGALRARMKKAAAAAATPAPIPFRPGHRVRYEDGSEALVLDVRARGVTTDHPLYPDIPLSHLNTLELIK